MTRFAMNVVAGNGIFEIYVGADGKLHIRWILPDPPPDLLAELRAVTVVLNEAAQLKNRAKVKKGVLKRRRVRARKAKGKY